MSALINAKNELNLVYLLVVYTSHFLLLSEACKMRPSDRVRLNMYRKGIFYRGLLQAI